METAKKATPKATVAFGGASNFDSSFRGTPCPMIMSKLVTALILSFKKIKKIYGPETKGTKILPFHCLFENLSTRFPQHVSFKILNLHHQQNFKYII